MPTDNAIRVQLARDGARVGAVQLRAGAPVPAATLLRGREPGAAAVLLPRLFSVCAEAQGVAAEAACRAATGADAAPVAGREAAVRLETLHEHLWRVLVDWPQAAGREPDYAGFAPVRAALASARGGSLAPEVAVAQAAALARQAVFGGEPADFAAIGSVEGLQAWFDAAGTLPARLLGALWHEAPALGRSAVPLLPALATLDPAALAAAVEGAEPRWGGGPAETGPLARQQAQPLVAALLAQGGATAAARFVARLMELAGLLGAGVDGGVGQVRAFAVGDGGGLGAVETARGLLLHRVRLQGGRIADYRILAPTDWNFAPGGPLVAGLRLLEGADPRQLQRHARLAVLALDPCVACTVELADA